MIILLNTVKTIGHGIFKITNRAVKLILLRRISFAIHKHKAKEEKHCSTARQLFRPRLISSVTRNNWRENANPDSLLKDGYLSLDKQNRDNQMPQKGRLRSFTRGSDYRDLTGKILVFLDRWALI